MKGLEFVFLAVGSVLGAYLRFKVTESPLLFNTLPVNVLIVNVIGAFILGAFVIMSQQWNLDGRYSLFAAVGFCDSPQCLHLHLIQVIFLRTITMEHLRSILLQMLDYPLWH